MKKFTNLSGRVCRYGLIALVLAAVAPGVRAQDGITLVERGPVVLDVMGKLEWMRCSIGQVWVDGRCDGVPLLAPFAAGEAIIARAAASSGEGWRIPTRAEMERLVVFREAPPLIDSRMFPQTHQGGYWTADANWLLAGGHWIVNFNSGFSYGRALPRQSFAFRLVRDR
ncbi:MAG: DUF1566 domain-containing protein [Shimia sp.]|uniref:Lcl C-terminal domain-containing protein n=1 Tax=Shimia sp. TaxID=1954381 RepID=UPI001B0B63A5|nr:DUF1566 domain-containing protein [Shimia sp.]MBO6898107.1 DUF1566 domain-containing protein [Shimia sp.]